MKKFIITLAALLCLAITPSFAQLKVTEAKLGAGVDNRVVTGEGSTFTKDSKVYFWVKTAGGTGDVTVTWKHGDKTHTKTLTIGGNPWRTWAYMTAYAAGDWSVTLTDDKGTVLKEMTFKVE